MLTTRQRDLLHLLIHANAPVPAADLADHLHVTARQVNYDLQRVEGWLDRHDAMLSIKPGAGVRLYCPDNACDYLARALEKEPGFRLVIDQNERRQILALNLLTAPEPYILRQLETGFDTSRSTVLKDLAVVEKWLAGQGVDLERRPNYGIKVNIGEQQRRGLLARLVWDGNSFDSQLFKIDHTSGLTFSLARDAHFLPMVEQASAIVRRWEVVRCFNQIAFIETRLGGRFTDDAVLILAVVLAIQAQRIQDGHLLKVDEDIRQWLKEQSLWGIAGQVANHLSWGMSKGWSEDEIASIAMHVLAMPRNERWPGDLKLDAGFTSLIDALLTHVGQAYKMPHLESDQTLRDGVVNHVIPACLGRRFDLVLPALLSGGELDEAYRVEHDTARELSSLVHQHAGVFLPDEEVANLALLLRAAFIRARPTHQRQVIVVCPSGIATAQLLVARIKARFPRLQVMDVLSLREVHRDRVADVDLVITTVPLPPVLEGKVDVIQVHPLLLPEDIEAITHWLA